MTTLEDRIADLQQQAGLLLDLPQQIADTATARINQIGDYWDTRVAGMTTVAYIHQQIGDDGAAGSESAPLRSIEEALRRTPPGGYALVRMMSDYHISTSVTPQHHLKIQSADTVRHQLTFERYLGESANTTYRNLQGFNLVAGSYLQIDSLTIVVPDEAGYENYPQSSATPPFRIVSFNRADGALSLTNCDIVIPTAPYGALVRSGGAPLRLFAYALTATDQPLTGRLLAEATATGGTDPATLPWLLTNLSQV